MQGRTGSQVVRPQVRLFGGDRSLGPSGGLRVRDTQCLPCNVGRLTGRGGPPSGPRGGISLAPACAAPARVAPGVRHEGESPCPASAVGRPGSGPPAGRRL